ncbi:hypothetical protein ASPSYDRAFT_31307 [Aspergillus sydowii CBS 593.65]|uniref:Secreted protein n=1 Tax=Aspergillus sydowii CBS 593.65 TaxID=1036612 RepID=A0A1L9TGY4_9EURO|nr:uncharacterized protein ASPSYDRAFT_31307 [Aspergillus sydowii CBS 593.65]OJJ58655.1 hypothetical protein ASPSYDRAFT_31307 [Aspergillus sydowii CBS 593.65]
MARALCATLGLALCIGLGHPHRFLREAPSLNSKRARRLLPRSALFSLFLVRIQSSLVRMDLGTPLPGCRRLIARPRGRMQPLPLPTTPPLFKVTNGFALQPVDSSCTTSPSTRNRTCCPGSHSRISERTGR